MILKDEETRNKILMTTMSIVILVVFLFALPFYLVTNPLEAFAMFLDDDSMTLVSDFQNLNGFYGDGAIIDINGDYIESEIPLFIQWDSRWNLYSYGNSTIGKGGCGPTSLAMVAVGLTGDTSVNPKVVADYSVRNGYRVDGVGTAWGLMTRGAKDFGLRSQEFARDKRKIAEYLREGKPIIASMAKGHFTSQGHFIVLTGITEDGRIIVNDSNSYEKSAKTWDMDIIYNECRGLWAFEKINQVSKVNP